MEAAKRSIRNTLNMYVNSIEELKILFNQDSNPVLEFFEQCFKKTEYCITVDTVEWLPHLQFIIFSRDSQKINQQEAIEEISKHLKGKVEDR